MKILIINPPIRLNDKPRNIPHGLAILANLIRKKLNITPQFLDINANRYTSEQVESILRSTEFDVVLIGGLIPVYSSVIFYADIIKNINSEAIIIAGGSAAMSVPKLLLNNSKVDVVCAGEGEKVIIDLLEGLQGHSLEDLTDIKGFYYKVKNEIIFSGKPDLISDLDNESDMPAYDMLPMEIYLSNPIIGFGRDIDFISSRGCPFSCTFCYQPWGRKFRAHSVDFMIDTIKYLKKNYKIDFLSFQDDEFMANKERTHEFCERVQKEIPELLWSVTGRVNIVNETIVGAMKKAGCVSISYGFESGSPRMLKTMMKHATIEQMEEAARVNRKFGMMLPVSFIIGMPGENEESCQETVDFCVRNGIPLKSIMFATPYPGTSLFEQVLSEGRIPKEKVHDFVLTLADARDFTINLTDAFSDEELIAKREDMINEVNGKVKINRNENTKKLKDLFGNLISQNGFDKKHLKHRSEHGGIDIF